MASDIQALHYSTHAAQDILDTAARIPPVMVSTSAKLVRVVDILKDAVKFILPDNGELIDFTKVDEATMDLLRLPFPVVALEIPHPPGANLIEDGPLKETPSSRRIALVWDASFAPSSKISPDYKKPGVYVLALYYTDLDKCWQVSPMGAFLPQDAEVRHVKDGAKGEVEQLTFDTLRAIDAITEKSPIIAVNYFNVLPQMLELLAAAIGQKAALARMEMDVRDELMATWAFCMTVNCLNVKLGTVPAPAKLNAKRLKAGKLPFYESKVLELPSAPVAERGSAAGDSSDASRSGPRMHLRRGHPRRLQSGKVTYVRAALVGSAHEGQVQKTYKVTARA